MTSCAVTGRPRLAIVAVAVLLALSLLGASPRPAIAAPVAFHAATTAAPKGAGGAHLVPVVWGRGGGGFRGGFGGHPFMRGRFDRDDRFFHGRFDRDDRFFRGRFGDRDDRFFRGRFFGRDRFFAGRRFFDRDDRFFGRPFNRPFFARGPFFFRRPFFFPRPFVFGRFDGVRFGFFP